jgi:uncharacterized protein
MPAQYILRASSDGQYFFSLTAANNQKILASERYKSKDGAKNGIESVRTNSKDDSRYDRRTSSDGKHYFVLKAANQQIIGKSETYSSKQAMENGISAVKSVGPDAPVSDQT